MTNTERLILSVILDITLVGTAIGATAVILVTLF